MVFFKDGCNKLPYLMLLLPSLRRRVYFFTSLYLGWPFESLDQQNRVKIMFCWLREKPWNGLAASTSAFLEHSLLACSLLEAIWDGLRRLSHRERLWVHVSVSSPRWAFRWQWASTAIHEQAISDVQSRYIYRPIASHNHLRDPKRKPPSWALTHKTIEKIINCCYT